MKIKENTLKLKKMKIKKSSRIIIQKQYNLKPYHPKTM